MRKRTLKNKGKCSIFGAHREKIAWEDGKLIGRCKCGFVKEYDPAVEPTGIALHRNEIPIEEYKRLIKG